MQTVAYSNSFYSWSSYASHCTVESNFTTLDTTTSVISQCKTNNKKKTCRKVTRHIPYYFKTNNKEWPLQSQVSPASEREHTDEDAQTYTASCTRRYLLGPVNCHTNDQRILKTGAQEYMSRILTLVLINALQKEICWSHTVRSPVTTDKEIDTEIGYTVP